MKNFFTALVLVGGAIGLFLTFTQPRYDEVTLLQAEIDEYETALRQVDEFESLKNSLLAEYNTFDANDIARLEKMIPLNVDNVRLIIEIEAVASSHGLEISEVTFGEGSTESETPEPEAPPLADSESALPGAPGMMPSLNRGSARAPGSVLMTFSTTAAYDNFKAFMEDLEKSLRIVDIQKVSSDLTESGLADYQVTFKTYWLGNQ